jgi:hypothetical protein
MQHRSNPILDTLEEVPGLPSKVKLCKIPASPFYYVRTWMGGKPLLRSLKTERQGEARKSARAFYDELLLKTKLGQPLTEGTTFKKAADALLEDDRRRVARGERKQSLVRDGEYILPHLIEFFKKDHVRAINYQRIEAYVRCMGSKDKKPSAATIRNHLIWLSKVLRHANKLNLLDKMPVFPTVTRVDNPRPWFDKEQYKLLLKTCKECEGQTPPGNKVHFPITNELRWVCMFLANSFLRPTDLKNLRNRDIAVIKNRDTRYLRITAKSKGKPSPVVTMPVAVDVYEKLTSFNTAAGSGSPEDYVFFPKLNRTYMFQTMRLQFNYVLEKAGLKKSDGEVPRTLYSLRHSAIMFSIIDSEMDITSLAKNCRTSEDMIRRFYSSHLQAEMNIAKLHKKRSPSGVAEIIHKMTEQGEYWGLVHKEDDSEMA